MDADTWIVSVRTFVVLGLTLSALVVGWRVLLPASNDASEDVAGEVTTLLDTVTRAQFTGAQATLETQRRLTGSYAGAAVAPPLRLARADMTSYCIELVRNGAMASLVGPGGTPQPGACS